MRQEHIWIVLAVIAATGALNIPGRSAEAWGWTASDRWLIPHHGSTTVFWSKASGRKTR